MWLFTETGFVSAVILPKDPDTLIVRARDRQSLEPLADQAGVEILTTKMLESQGYGSDYYYRVLVPRATFTQGVAEQISILDYKNFKDQVAVTRDKNFAHTLGEVWGVMLGVEDAECKEYYSARHAKIKAGKK